MRENSVLTLEEIKLQCQAKLHGYSQSTRLIQKRKNFVSLKHPVLCSKLGFMMDSSLDFFFAFNQVGRDLFPFANYSFLHLPHCCGTDDLNYGFDKIILRYATRLMDIPQKNCLYVPFAKIKSYTSQAQACKLEKVSNVKVL